MPKTRRPARRIDPGRQRQVVAVPLAHPVEVAALVARRVVGLVLDDVAHDLDAGGRAPQPRALRREHAVAVERDATRPCRQLGSRRPARPAGPPTEPTTSPMARTRPTSRRRPMSDRHAVILPRIARTLQASRPRLRATLVAMRPRRVLQNPTADVEPFDPAAFPGVDERLRADGGAASERWRDLVASNRTIIADGAMGTMLFANGLLFGDPPEVWNLSKPDVIRRIHRGYLDAGSQILMTNTFGGNRMRLSLHGLQDRVAELNQTAAILLRNEVDAAGGDALVAGDIGPSGADPRADRHARLRRGGRHLRRAGGGPRGRWRRPHLDRDDVRPPRDQGRHRGRPARVAGHRAHHDDDLRHPRPDDDGRHPRAGPRVADRVGRGRGRWQLRQRPRRAHHGHRADARRRSRTRASSPSRTRGCPSSSTCAPSTAPTPRRWPPPRSTMRDMGASIIGGCCGNTPEHLAAIAAAVRGLSAPADAQ